MKPFVENSLKEFVKKRDDIFGIESVFVDFEGAVNTDHLTEGYQSDTIFGYIRYKNETGNILSSPPLVLKLPKTTSFRAELFFQFINEIFVYGHILPYFALLESSVLELFPKFYGSFTETYPKSSEAVILLENLGYSSYQNAPFKSFLDYAHLALMVRSLGKFHAFSCLAKELDPVNFQAHALSLNPICGATIGRFRGSSKIVGARGLTLSLQKEYKSFVPVIQNLLENADEIAIALYRNERNNPWAVVCHGDYLSGNVMFKYDKGQPVHLKMFDLSTSTFSSPALDLALVLYLNADQETRDLYWDQLIDDYCDGLSSLSIPIVNLPSRDIIIKELQLKAFYAYLIASYFLPFLLSLELPGSFHQFLPPEYMNCNDFLELPLNVQIDFWLKAGGEIVTQHLSDVLKDMLKRGFIQSSGLFNANLLT